MTGTGVTVRAAAAVAAAAMLGGCEQFAATFKGEKVRTEVVEGRLRQPSSSGEQVRVWRDPETGCQYLIWENRRRGGVTPRLNGDGRPMCRPG